VKALLINPWIADFAAYNFWIRPLGLYRLASWLDTFGIDVSIIDCLSPFDAPGKLRRKIVTNPPFNLPIPMDRSFARYGISKKEFRQRLHGVGSFDVVFITSIMSYWYLGIKWVIDELKRYSHDIPIILGGIYATLWSEHAQKELGVDFVCKGPLEINQDKLKSFLGLYNEIRHARPWYEILPWDFVNYGAVRTALGCPFSCTYCASKILTGGFNPLDTKDVINELLFYHLKGVRQIAFYDDALLVDFEKRLLPILSFLNKKQILFEFHTPNGLHARLINEKVAKWLVRSNFRTIRLSLETISRNRQKITGGKVSNEEFKEAVNLLLKAGMPSENIGVYLLIGLPGQDLEEVYESIIFVKKLGIRPYLAEFSPIPGTVEWQHLEKMHLVSKDMDPIFTNNTLFFRIYSNYDMERFNSLKRLARS